MAGVFYSAAQDFVLDELQERRNKDYVESRKSLGCYINISAQRTSTVYQKSKDLDTWQAVKEGAGTVTRGVTDFIGGQGTSNVLFGEAKHNVAMETVETPVGTKMESSAEIGTNFSERYGSESGKPLPAITKFEVEMSGDYGSLKKAELTIKCFDKVSFEEIEEQLMIPGTEVNISYGRVNVSGPANNTEFKGVVYDYSFKLNEYLGYDCTIKAVGKGSLVTEMNVMAKLTDDGRMFVSDYKGLNEKSTVVNICDVFDYDVQNKMDDHVDLDEDESYTFPGWDRTASIAGTDCPNAAPEPKNDNMVGGNVIFASLGYIVNKLINQDLLNGNIEGSKVDTTGVQYVCDNKVTIGRFYDKIFSANPMNVLILGSNQQQQYGGTAGGLLGRFFGASKIWGQNFDCPPVMAGNKAELANILISRDCIRGIAGAGGMGDAGSKVPLSKFLNGIFQEIYNCTGGAYDLTVSEMTPEQCEHYGWSGDPEGKMFIVDRNWVPGTGVKKIQLNANTATDYYSTRNVSLDGKVPKDMAAAAFVGGTGATSGKKHTAVEVIKGKKITKLDNIGKILNGLIESREVIHDTGYIDESITSAKTNLKAYIEGVVTARDKASFRKDMYPLELSATIEGLAGIQFGNACETNLAPSRYYDNGSGMKIVFTVTKTKHTISPNDWITDITTICRMEP